VPAPALAKTPYRVPVPFGAIEDADGPVHTVAAAEELTADFKGTGMTLGPHPMTFARESCAARA
jgi:hypothetical protein